MTATRETSDISPCNKLMILPGRVVVEDLMVSCKHPEREAVVRDMNVVGRFKEDQLRRMFGLQE
jgi:hypothetical protein